MSNAALQSKLSSLRSELSRAQAVNSQLRSELNTVANGANHADNQLTQYNNHLQSSLQTFDSRIETSHGSIVNAIEMQAQIDRMYVLFKNIELANKKIRACNHKKYYDFANYRTVRKLVQGVMDNVESNMVGHDVVTRSIEKTHLQAPDYWLTCVLLSIMAWQNDDHLLAERAMERGISLDKKKAAIFYLLFNLQISRAESALKWFQYYQQVDRMGSDDRTFLMLLSLMSEAVQGELDQNLCDEIKAFIQKVVLEAAVQQNYSEEKVVQKILYQLNKKKPNEMLSYNDLRDCCQSYNELQSIMMCAKNNINILQFIVTTMTATPEQKNQYIKEFTDDLLLQPNVAEEAVYNEIIYNEFIIQCKGDVEVAKQKFAVETERLSSELNLVSELITWLYDKENQDITAQMRANAFVLTSALHDTAIQQHIAEYRARRTSVLSIVIDDYSANVNFNRESEEERSVEAYYIAQKEASLAEIKDTSVYMGAVVAGVSVVAAFFIGMWTLVVAVVAAGYSGIVWWQNKINRKEVEQVCIEKIQNTTARLRKLFVEFKEYQKELDEYDAYSERIAHEFEKI